MPYPTSRVIGSLNEILCLSVGIATRVPIAGSRAHAKGGRLMPARMRGWVQPTPVLEGFVQRVGFPTTLEEPFVLCHSTFHVGGRSADNRPDCRLLAEYGITMAELMEQQLKCFIKILHLMMVRRETGRRSLRKEVQRCVLQPNLDPDDNTAQ